MSELPPRVLDIIARYGFVIAVVLAVGSLLAFAGAAHTYTSPPVETVTTQANQKTYAVNVQTSALVENNSSLYEEGERIRNMPVYFFAGTPNLTFHVTASVPSNQSVTITHRLLFVMQGTREGQAFWQSRRVITATRNTTTTGTVRATATINMSELARTIREKQATVGAVGTFQATVRLNTTYEGETYSGQLAAQSPVVLTDQGYWLQAPLNDSRTHSTSETRRVVQSPNRLQIAGLIGVGLLGLVSALAIFRRYQTVDREAIATQRARNRYDEWISNGEIPTKSSKEYVRTDSLEDLVDIAIDTNKRVIYDRDLDAYGVVESNLVYYYTTGDTELTDWLDI